MRSRKYSQSYVAEMGSGINKKFNKFLYNPKNVKKRRNTILEKCYGQVNIATAYFQLTTLRENDKIKTAVFEKKSSQEA